METRNIDQQRCLHFVKHLLKNQRLATKKHKEQMEKVTISFEKFLEDTNMLFKLIDDEDDVKDDDAIDDNCTKPTEKDFVSNMKRIMHYPPPRITQLDGIVVSKLNDNLSSKNEYIEFFVKRKHRGKNITVN